MMNLLITIDGPSGVGKTTLGTLLAEELESNFFSSGKLYRIIASYTSDFPSSLIQDYSLVINNDLSINLNNQSYVDSQLYTKEINSKSSEIAKSKKVRKLVSNALTTLSKNLDNGLIIEGRDMGSVVFPDADLKIYLDADIEVRAKRRLKQSNESETLQDIKTRDQNDLNREESPLTIPDNALYIDNTSIDMDEVLRIVKENLELQ